MRLLFTVAYGFIGPIWRNDVVFPSAPAVSQTAFSDEDMKRLHASPAGRTSLNFGGLPAARIPALEVFTHPNGSPSRASRPIAPESDGGSFPVLGLSSLLLLGATVS